MILVYSAAPLKLDGRIGEGLDKIYTRGFHNDFNYLPVVMDFKVMTENNSDMVIKTV